MHEVKLGIIGCGTIGGGVYEALKRNGGLVAARIGVKLDLVRVAERDLESCAR